VVQPELMDAADVPPADLAASLRDLRRVNRWLGGAAAALRRLTPLLRRLHTSRRSPIRLLDVGTGSADLPLLLLRWCRRQRIDLRVVALDFHPTTVRLAAAAVGDDPAVRVVRADALALPFSRDAFHLSLCSTALHHFADSDAATVLREMDRVASDGMLVSDLRRSRLAMTGARALAATVWRTHPLTRHDGPRSVQGAFTAGELRSLARRAGLEGAAVRHEPVFRISLLVDRTRMETT
jgi:SAM-dependent methyltransferase